MSNAAGELEAQKHERALLLATLRGEARTIRKLEKQRDAAYARRLDLYRELVEIGTVHRVIANAAGVSETAISLALRPK